MILSSQMSLAVVLWFYPFRQLLREPKIKAIKTVLHLPKKTQNSVKSVPSIVQTIGTVQTRSSWNTLMLNGYRLMQHG